MESMAGFFSWLRCVRVEGDFFTNPKEGCGFLAHTIHGTVIGLLRGGGSKGRGFPNLP